MRTCVMGFNHKCGCEDATDMRAVIDALAPVISGLVAGDELGTALMEWPEGRDYRKLREALDPFVIAATAVRTSATQEMKEK